MTIAPTKIAALANRNTNSDNNNNKFNDDNSSSSNNNSRAIAFINHDNNENVNDTMNGGGSWVEGGKELKKLPITGRGIISSLETECKRTLGSSVLAVY